MTIKTTTFGLIALSALLGLVALGCSQDADPSADAKDRQVEKPVNEKEPKSEVEARADRKTQATCPVMGNPINKDIYADHDGKRVYFCCPGCDATFKKDPEKYLKVLEDKGEQVELIQN